MAAFNKFNQFVEDIAKGVHNPATGALTIALTASANAPVATNTVLANLTQISYTNLSSRLCTTTSCVQTSGTLMARSSSNRSEGLARYRFRDCATRRVRAEQSCARRAERPGLNAPILRR